MSAADERENTVAWNPLFIQRYLLGDAPGADRARFEEEYMHDDAVLDAVYAVEGELIDAYVQGTLPAADRARFETHFLVTERRRQRLAFARDVRAVASDAPRATARPGRRAWLSAAAALVAAALGWALFANRAAHRSIDDSTIVATRTLTPGAVRSSGAVETLRLAQATGRVRLQLPLRNAGAFDRYAARLEDATTRELWRESPVVPSRTADGDSVTVTVPARLLSPGDFALVLSGLDGTGRSEDVEQYLLRVQIGH